MTYIDPTNVVDPTSAIVKDLQANGSYTGSPQHVIIDGKDFLIVDADSHGVAVYGINSATGALIEPPTYLTWPQQPGEAEFAHFDEYSFYTSPDGSTVTGFDADNLGVTALSYDVASGTWSTNYDVATAAGGVETGFRNFDTFQGTDGTVYGYASSTANSQTYTKYTWDWTNKSWTQVSTVTPTDINATTASDYTRYIEMVTADDGTQYMVGYGGATNQYTNIYEINPATGDIIPGTNVRMVSSNSTNGPGVLGDFMGGGVSMDPNGNMVFHHEYGVQVIDPSTGAYLFEDNRGGDNGSTFYYGSDLVYGDDGYIYLVGRNGNGSLDTKVYKIDSNGDWQFVTQGVDASSTITWTGYQNGTYTESKNDVTTLSSGLKMIYTTQEQGANGPTTLIAGQVSTIGEGEVVASICFVAGTLIETENGRKPVEELEVGDLVRTKDNGYKPILWIDSNTLTLDGSFGPEFYPIRIKANALGKGYPETDLYVSQQHRILLKSQIVKRVVGADEVLVAAKKLLDLDGVDIVTNCDEVTYVHFLFDQHEVVYANGAETESLYTGPEAMKSIDEKARNEIFRLFPDLMKMDYKALPARILPSGKMSRKIAMRHAKNNVALYTT